MKKSKVLLALACAVLLVGASIMGTLAYLTSTDTVKNTFTVGNVKITLDEAKVNGNGEPIKEGKDGAADTVIATKDKDGKTLSKDKLIEALAGATRVEGNSYKLMPGHSYTKDPTVTVDKASEESYIRLLVTVTFDKELTDAEIATSLDSIFENVSTKWVRNSKSIAEDKKTITYEYRYVDGDSKTVKVTDTSKDLVLDPLFTGFTVPGTWDSTTIANLGGFTMTVDAQAIQADGFDTADAAWASFSTTTNS